MKSKLQLLQEESLRTGLADDERQSLRNSLLAYIDQNPIKEEASQSRFSFSPFSQFSRLGAAAVVLLLLATSVVYAAERSIPGDMLYPVKVGFNEKVRESFAFTDKSKANLEVSLADRRLQEAEALQDQSRLSAQMKASIVEAFSIQVAEVSTHVEKMAQEQKFDDIKDTTARFQSSLQAHAKILPVLSLIGPQATATATTSTSTSTLNSIQ